MLNLFSRFVDSNQRDLNRLSKIAESINSLEKKYQKLTDKQLKDKTEEFKKDLSQGKTLEQILPDVFATVREAFIRSLKVRLYDVQLIAAITLHEGNIAEQKTGEGKTFSAVPALYLNSLLGKGVHLVTVNDYLARREAGWTGPVYEKLGVKIGSIVHDESFIFDPKFKETSHVDTRLNNLKPVSRKEAYNADITVGTNNEFGFDYLRDNMVRDLSQYQQRGHYFAVVDEVDSILIDEARTPLIISAPSGEPTQKYFEFAKLIDKLSAETDYTIDEKQRTASLTEAGILRVEKLLGVDNLYEKDFSTLHHIEQSLKSKTLFQKDKDYVVKDGEVIIVDEFTGRLMPGRRYSEGLHQAIEAKEAVTIQQESQTLATISFQNYFRMYQKLAGMTGTASTESEEFHKIYNLNVLVIPTHRPMVRIDQPDMIYKTQTAKYNAVAEEIVRLHKNGQPVLVGTTSIEKNEYLSNLLKKLGISHALLNAKNHEKEADIISKAGEKGAVTVATNMAGRGVDIKLSKGVTELGGLYVLGTERHESRRIDNQLRGRSGRQGDPGASRFFVSLEDDLMRIFGGEQVAKVMNFLKIPEDTPIEHGMVSKAIESAQKKVEGHNFDARKYTVEYDDVMNQQRQVIYGIRKRVLAASEHKEGLGLKDEVLEKIDKEIEQLVLIHTAEGVESKQIIDRFSSIINFDPNSQAELEKQVSNLGSHEEITSFLIKLAHDLYEAREKEFGVEVIRQMEVFVYLNVIDTLWVEHLDSVDDLRTGIGLRSFGQREPLVEYKREAFDMFDRLIKTIDSSIVHQIYKLSTQGRENIPLSQPLPQIKEIHQEALEQKIEHLTDSPTRVTVERGGQVISQQTIGSDGGVQKQKIGRNDPCWCRSGKKYKKCHYPN
ncbi:preprotein translocase subunit SecA [Candidatus Daviesbacteria bacterium RIFCSPLOWO2_02_FULL_40_8]|nr:MAG: preprotein translocase subunit SecA [Candidatus Daviesbacteria bacterium RIFCSPLOWO2_02_FULL_40_8]